ncbi:MAG: tetratricopeptide repeat protein [Rhizobiales bacterium]|nr:tetratricopeptide repeat protein [Hyphomicrobiales bacterium]
MASERVQRRLAAVMAADVVGYSRMMERDEATTLAALKDRRRRVLTPLLAVHQGRIVKLMGDGFLAEFGSAVNAVECAIAFQQGLDAANDGIADDSRIIMRVGISLGDVVVEGSDLYGDGVNIAARLEQLAEPGGILVSGSVHDFLRNRPELAFEDAGLQQLKNISTPVHSWRIRSTSRRKPAEAKVSSGKPTIAVLPLTNMSGDPAQSYFSDGITEDIITELSRFRSLRVIARNSSFQYRDKAVDIRRAGQELGAQYVVEGSIRAAGSRVRITAQLIDAVTGNHVWSERYDRDVQDLFAVQDEVTRMIVATITGRVESVEIEGATQRRTENLTAYDILLRGVELLRGNNRAENVAARKLFERAIELDPRFALAHAYLSMSLLVEHRYDSASEEIKERAVNEGLTAVRLDPCESRCHQFLAQAYRFHGDFDLALMHFQRALALNPNDATGLALMGSVLGIAGRPDEGAELIRQAMTLNPFHPSWYWGQLAIVLYAARRYEEALEADRRGADQTQFWFLARMAACHAQLGRLEEAKNLVAEVLRRKPDFRLSAIKLKYRDEADAEHVLDGMRKAGLPA